MRRLLLIALLATLALTATAAPQPAKVAERTRVLIVLDCSHSMWERWQSDTKIKVTQRVLLRFLDSIAGQSEVEVALRVFGHLNKDAYATRLEVPFEADNNYKLQSKIKTLVPNSGCTAASALTSAQGDFPQEKGVRNIILIITDGMDDCDGNICDVTREVQRSGSVVKTFIIGIGDAADFQQRPDCAGHFIYLPGEELFDETLHEVFHLSDQKARVTLAVTDEGGDFYECEVPVAFCDHQTHAVRYATIYHYGTEDAVDTLAIDPLTTYDITFFTQPPIRLTGRQLRAGRHNHVAVVAPQGTLSLRYENRRAAFTPPSCPVLVRSCEDGTLLAHCQMGAAMAFRTGRYDVEVLTQPTLTLKAVEVRSGSATDLQIPMPGQLALQKPQGVTTGSIFVCQEDGLRWVCDLDASQSGERITLLPGEYQVVLKPQDAADYASTRTADFAITTANQTTVKME